MYSSRDRLAAILESIDLIQERFSKIKRPEDFVLSKEGLSLLDSIAMRLQVIGENFSKILKQDEALINDKLQIDVDPIVGFRNFISHHYELLDHEIVFKICSSDLPPLKKVPEDFLT